MHTEGDIGIPARNRQTATTSWPLQSHFGGPRADRTASSHTPDTNRRDRVPCSTSEPHKVKNNLQNS